MKVLKYISIIAVLALITSCMGKDYAEPELDPSTSPWGNNEIKAENVISIQQLKNIPLYKQVIENSGNRDVVNTYAEIDQDIKIKGIVTGVDEQSNIYQNIALQDSTGAIIINISASGLHSYLPVGQEILVDLKGLCIGGYRKQAQVGVPYTNAKGVTSVGRMDRYTWQQHVKLIGTADRTKADALTTDFDITQISNERYLRENSGKLMTIKRVVFKDANGRNVYAPEDGSVPLVGNSVNRQIKLYNSSTTLPSSQIVVRTSPYAKFAKEVITSDTVNITGIFTRFGNTWQIAMRSLDDLSKAQLAYFSEPFTSGLGDFTTHNLIPLPSGLSYVWSFSSAYGAKASAYVSGTNYATSTRLESPAIDLSSASSATLHFSHAARFFSDAAQELKVQATTDGTHWTDLKVSAYPDGSNWNFIGATVNLNAFCGKKNVKIGFLYTSTNSRAATWEIKSVTVD